MEKRLLPTMAAMIVITILAGCGDYADYERESGGILIGEGPSGSTQEPTRIVLPPTPPPAQPQTTTVGAAKNGDAIKFSNEEEVLFSPVGLQLEPRGVQVVTSAPPTAGTLIILVRTSYWWRIEDEKPFESVFQFVTITMGADSSKVFPVNLWPGVTTEVAIEPLEVAKEAIVKMRAPDRDGEEEKKVFTRERHEIQKDHRFVAYEPVEEHRRLVFPPQ